MTGSNQVTIPEGSVPPRPDGVGKPQVKAREEWDKMYSNTHNADGTPKT